MTKLEEEFELSRNPKDYSASTHLIQRVKERKTLEFDVVNDIIEEGEVIEVDENEGNSDLCITLKGDWLMSTFEVKLCPKDKLVQTAYEVES